MSTTLSSVGKRLLENLPTPIALNWGLLVRATSDSERQRLSWAVLDSFLRYTCGILLSDYLRGEKIPAVEHLLPKLAKPSRGHYCALIRAMLRPLTHESDFYYHIQEWYYTPKGKPTEMARLLDTLINKRNLDAHGAVQTEEELHENVKTILFELQNLLHKAKWLSGYQLFTVESTQAERRGGQRGSVLFYHGDIKQPLPSPSSWSCILFEECIYVTHPKGDRFLEVNPFIHIESNGRNEELYLWVSTPKEKHLKLRCDANNEELKRLPVIVEEEMAWSTWLERRNELDPTFINTHTSAFTSGDFQEIGMVIDERYKIMERLGDGGMGVVYLVQDLLLDEEVALKVLHLEQVDGSDKERIKAEFKFMKSLSHPNILSVQNFSTLKDGRVAISMPVMQGTLKDMLNSPLLEQSTIEGWAEDMLSALEYLHTSNPPIFHRDIKPSNMLLADDQTLLLSDFGIARKEGDVRLTRTNDTLGSLPYMAPELLRGIDAGPASDRFALAISLHEMITGELPRKNEVGVGITGEFGKFITELGSENTEDRMMAVWPPKPVPTTTAEPEYAPSTPESDSNSDLSEQTNHPNDDSINEQSSLDESVKESVEQDVVSETQALPSEPTQPVQDLDAVREIEHNAKAVDTVSPSNGDPEANKIVTGEVETKDNDSSDTEPTETTETKEAKETKATDEDETKQSSSIPKIAVGGALAMLLVIGGLVSQRSSNVDPESAQTTSVSDETVKRTDIPTKDESETDEPTEDTGNDADAILEQVKAKVQEPLTELQVTVDKAQLCELAVLSDHMTIADRLFERGKNLWETPDLVEAISLVSDINTTHDALVALIEQCNSQPQTLTVNEYLTKGKCLSCHSTDGTKGTGPTFKGLYGSKKRVSALKKITVGPKYLTQQIMNHQNPSNVVDDLGDTDEAQQRGVASIVEYIKGL